LSSKPYILTVEIDDMATVKDVWESLMHLPRCRVVTIYSPVRSLPYAGSIRTTYPNILDKDKEDGISNQSND
jgi:hypothetical protein